MNNAIDGSPKNINMFLMIPLPTLKESNLTILPIAINNIGTTIGAKAFQVGGSPPISLIRVS